MAATKGAKIIEFPAGGRKKPAAFKTGAIKEEKRTDQGMSRDTCISILETLAPLSEGLKGKLEIPQRMHSVSATATSLSSDPGKSAMELAGYLLRGAPFPEDLPDYGIHIASSGSNSFAILCDSARKIIVCESVENAYAENGSWASFESSLSEAISAAGSLKREGRPFRFVAVKDGLISII